jgi:hypothetical protein
MTRHCAISTEESVRFKTLTRGTEELSTHFSTFEEIEEQYLMEASVRSNMCKGNSYVIEFQTLALIQRPGGGSECYTMKDGSSSHDQADVANLTAYFVASCIIPDENACLSRQYSSAWLRHEVIHALMSSKLDM